MSRSRARGLVAIRHRHRAYDTPTHSCVAALLGERPGLPCDGGEVQLLPRAAVSDGPIAARLSGVQPTTAIQATLQKMPWTMLSDRSWPRASGQDDDPRWRLTGLRLYADEMQAHPRAVWTWAPEETGARLTRARRVELRAATVAHAEQMRKRLPVMIRGGRAADVRVHAIQADPLADTRTKTEDYLAVSFVLDLDALDVLNLGEPSATSPRALANLAATISGLLVREVIAAPSPELDAGAGASP